MAIIATGIALAITTIVMCLLRRAARDDRQMHWETQTGPYYCEGPLYDRSHCSEAGLFQCPDCRKEQQLNGRPQ